MKQLTCEMCGSTDLIKQDGVFVCQNCGTKYSVEEAKKMMVEGTVEVTGTVKIDKNSDIDKYLELSQKADEVNQTADAIKYCDMVLEIEPHNYKAWIIKGHNEYGSYDRIIKYYENAIEYAPAEQRAEIGKQLIKKLEDFCPYQMSDTLSSKFGSFWAFAGTPEEDLGKIENSIYIIKEEVFPIFKKYNASLDEVEIQVSLSIRNFSICAWNDAQHTNITLAIMLDILELADSFVSINNKSKELKSHLILINKDKLLILEELLNCRPTPEERQTLNDKIIKCCKKLKEFDPTYTMPDMSKYGIPSNQSSKLAQTPQPVAKTKRHTGLGALIGFVLGVLIIFAISGSVDMFFYMLDKSFGSAVGIVLPFIFIGAVIGACIKTKKKK